MTSPLVPSAELSFHSSAFYERGSQEKHVGDDWMMIWDPAHIVMGRCGFRFSANSS
jgi:hypothetical protein